MAERLARLPPTPDELRALLPRLLQWVVEGLPVAPVIHVGPPIRGYPGTLFIGVLCPYCYRDHVRGWDGQGAYGHRWALLKTGGDRRHRDQRSSGYVIVPVTSLQSP